MDWSSLSFNLETNRLIRLSAFPSSHEIKRREVESIVNRAKMCEYMYQYIEPLSGIANCCHS